MRDGNFKLSCKNAEAEDDTDSGKELKVLENNITYEEICLMTCIPCTLKNQWL